MSHPTKILLISLTALFALGASGCVDLTPCRRGTEGCACTAEDTCEASTEGRSICAAGTCVVQRSTDEETACYDACAYRNDGICDDGGPGSEHADCLLGSDCSDCGVRPNPCFGTAEPVFCPQTPDECWPSNIDCLTVRYCNALLPAQRGPFGCGAGQAIDCNAVGGPVCVGTNTCQAMGQTPCVDETACVSAFIDCNSLVQCNGQPVACYTGEMVSCMVGQAPACVP